MLVLRHRLAFLIACFLPAVLYPQQSAHSAKPWVVTLWIRTSDPLRPRQGTVPSQVFPAAARRARAQVLRDQGRGVANAFVPPAHAAPFAFQYIERSTTMGTPLVTSMRAPNEVSCSSGTSVLTSTLNRLVGGSE